MIQIDRLASGAFKITVGVTSYFVTKLNFFTNGDSIIFNELSITTNYQNLAVNQVRDFANLEAACVALVEAGAGKSSFEKPAMPARGTVTLTAQPADTNTVSIEDGVVEAAKVFEFSGIKSAGLVALADDGTAGQPADGDSLLFDDGGDFETAFEFDSGRAFSCKISMSDGEAAKNPVNGTILYFGNHSFIFLTTPAGTTGHTEIEIDDDVADSQTTNIITGARRLAKAYLMETKHKNEAPTNTNIKINTIRSYGFGDYDLEFVNNNQQSILQITRSSLYDGKPSLSYPTATSFENQKSFYTSIKNIFADPYNSIFSQTWYSPDKTIYSTTSTVVNDGFDSIATNTKINDANSIARFSMAKALLTVNDIMGQNIVNKL